MQFFSFEEDDNNVVKQADFQFLKYAGTKIKYINTYRQLLSKIKSSTDTYIEPFVGGGSLYFNLSDDYDNVMINDANKNLITIYKSFKQCESFEYLKSFYEKNMLKFGNIGLTKENYYSFRSYINLLDNDDINKGLGWYFLSRSCINSMVRFGPNGFNQGWGERGTDMFITPDMFKSIKYTLQRTKLASVDYKKFDKVDTPSSVWILDPPYINTNMAYEKHLFNNTEFLDFIKSLKGFVIYSDIYDEKIETELEPYGYKVITIRDSIMKITPNKTAGTDIGREVIYYNF